MIDEWMMENEKEAKEEEENFNLLAFLAFPFLIFCIFFACITKGKYIHTKKITTAQHRQEIPWQRCSGRGTIVFV